MRITDVRLLTIVYPMPVTIFVMIFFFVPICSNLRQKNCGKTTLTSNPFNPCKSRTRLSPLLCKKLIKRLTNECCLQTKTHLYSLYFFRICMLILSFSFSFFLTSCTTAVYWTILLFLLRLSLNNISLFKSFMTITRFSTNC